MAGPLRNMLYRRPVRNAIRSLLGMQPRYGYGFSDPMGREEDDVGVRAASEASTMLPASPASKISSLGVGTPNTPAAAQAASLIAPPPNAMAQAKEQDDLPVAMPSPDQATGYTGIKNFRAPMPGIKAQSGPLANVPMVATPATTARPVTVDPAASQVAALREADMQRAAEKRRAAEGITPARMAANATPVSQTAPQAAAGDMANPATAAPAPGSDEALLSASQESTSEANQLRGQLDELAAKHLRAKTVDEQTQAAVQYSLVQSRYKAAQDRALSMLQMYEQRQLARQQLGLQQRSIDQQHPLDTAATNLSQLEQLTERIGMEQAVEAVTSQFQYSPRPTPVTPEQVAQFRNTQMVAAAPVELARRLKERVGFTDPNDPFVRSVTEIAKSQAATPQDRDRVIALIVNGGLRRAGVNNTQATINMTRALSRLVEQRIAQE